MNDKIASIFTDGGARNNPGPAGIGYLIKYKGKTTKRGEYIGKATNNQAEYQALIKALTKAKDLGIKQAEVFLDSELVVNQLNQKYKVKDSDLAKLFVKVWNLTQSFEKVKFHHIPRSKNKEADFLVNWAINRANF